MRKIKVWLSIGFARGNHNDELEIDDDATEQDIEELVQDWAYNYIDYGYVEL